MEYIYLLKNKETKRIYVGRTYFPEQRFRQHLSALRGNRHRNELMQQDFDLFGQDSFEMEVVEQRESFTRTNIEGLWIMKLKTFDERFGYNYKDPYVWHRTGQPTKNVANVNLN